MTHIRRASVVLLLSSLALGACDPPRRARDAGTDGGSRDRDGDTVLDVDEGLSDRRDTDGDGVIDAEDIDADGDGLSDASEAGDADLATPPIDSDRDGRPDAYDVDSDDDGRLDRDERALDTDGDGRLDAYDLDDDGDTLLDRDELRGMPGAPPDTDGDGLDDARDTDADGDTISDVHERTIDTDGDGLVDAIDRDADGDGVLDAEEAGDALEATPPIDGDGDGVADFRDPDSDDDGLSDHDEVWAHGTSRTSADGDGDGVGDLVEIAAGTDPADASVSPRTRGDFVFVMPFEAAPMPARETLSFRTRIQLADVYFLFDRSGSMLAEITALGGAVSSLLERLTCPSSGAACARDADCGASEICGVTRTCIEDPALSGCVASPHSGAGWYLGEYTNVLGLQDDPARTAAALSFGVTGTNESLYRALWGIASPMDAPGAETGCVSGGIGCPAFRADAARVIVAFTDEDSDGPETVEQAGAALSANGIDVVGVWTGLPASPERDELLDVVQRAGTVDRAGRPMVFDGADAAVVGVVRDAIAELVQGALLRVTIEAEDAPGDDGDALAFFERLEAREDACGGSVTEDADGDGTAETFPAVTPGTEVCWDVVVRENHSVPAIDRPQLLVAHVQVRGDGSLLDARDVYFVVPPRPPQIVIPE